MPTARDRSQNPLLFLHHTETPYAVDWEVLENVPPRARAEDAEPLVLLWRAESDAEEF